MYPDTVEFCRKQTLWDVMRAPASYSENWRVKRVGPAFPVQIIVHRNQLGSASEGQGPPNECVWTSRKF